MNADATILHDLPQPGDWRIAAAVARAKDSAEVWTNEKVTDWLRANPITDADLEAAFGPQWRQMVALTRRAAVLTEDDVKAMGTARFAIQTAAWDAAWNAVWYAAQGAERSAELAVARDVARNAAGDAVWNDANYATWGDADYAARDAAWALVVADLVGQHGLEQHHIDTLLAPWRKVIGDPLESTND